MPKPPRPTRLPVPPTTDDAEADPDLALTVKYDRMQTLTLPLAELRRLLRESENDKLQTIQLPQLPRPLGAAEAQEPPQTQLLPGLQPGKTQTSAAIIKAASTMKLAPIDAQRQTLITKGDSAPTIVMGGSAAPTVSIKGSSAPTVFTKGGSAVTVLMTAIRSTEPAPAKLNPQTFIGRFLAGTLPVEGAGAAAQPSALPKPKPDAQLQEVAFFRDLPGEQVRQALASAELQLLEIGRDVLLDTAHDALLVLAGQVALGRFDANKLAAERAAQKSAALQGNCESEVKRERLRRSRIGPLIRLASTNLATFSEGEVALLEDPRYGAELSLYTVTPILAVRITRPLLERWAGAYPLFLARLRRSLQLAQARITHQDAARALVADFFVRHGMSVALSLRVRELERCIECMECEAACAQRYGVKRLSLHGRLLGSVDFVDCCHTCIDQRCIDPCTFDAISFNAEKKEVLIDEAACTGCTLCATACPYNAIEMHELDEQPLLKLRLQKEHKLCFAPAET